MPILTGKGLAEFGKAHAAVNTPYVYGAKISDGVLTQTKVNWLARNYPKVFTMSYLKKIASKHLVGKICVDCSGLIAGYTNKVLGSAQLYSTAYARLPISQWQKFAIGTVLYKSGHVGIYLGDGLVAEAKGIDYGTVISNIVKTKWTHGLTFSYISYNINTPIASSDITYKGTNPYKEPTTELKRGITRNEGVRWLQWELVEAGYDIAIDGSFGIATENALKKFQSSAKLVISGICTAATIAALKSDGSSSSNNIYYTVVRGDTLSKIASKYSITVSDIVKLNNLKNPNLIDAGQKLKIK